MLQQTQVSRVELAWHSFLARFPTVSDAAAAGRSELVTLWAGLGYNNRAVRLHQAAQDVVNRFEGIFPRDLVGLMSLPGIGSYTARAVRAFAFELPAAVVDTNVTRVLARVSGRALTAAEAQRVADEWAEGADPWLWNQAMIDLGALVCTPRDPSCGRCPLADRCSWQGARGEDPGAIPASRRQAPFAGSDRQARGRLLDACRSGPVAGAELGAVMALDDDAERAERIVAAMVRDGLVHRSAGHVTLAD